MGRGVFTNKATQNFVNYFSGGGVFFIWWCNIFIASFKYILSSRLSSSLCGSDVLLFFELISIRDQTFYTLLVSTYLLFITIYSLIVTFYLLVVTYYS